MPHMINMCPWLLWGKGEEGGGRGLSIHTHDKHVSMVALGEMGGERERREGEEDSVFTHMINMCPWLLWGKGEEKGRGGRGKRTQYSHT